MNSEIFLDTDVWKSMLALAFKWEMFILEYRTMGNFLICSQVMKMRFEDLLVLSLRVLTRMDRDRADKALLFGPWGFVKKRNTNLSQGHMRVVTAIYDQTLRSYHERQNQTTRKKDKQKHQTNELRKETKNKSINPLSFGGSSPITDGGLLLRLSGLVCGAVGWGWRGEADETPCVLWQF